MTQGRWIRRRRITWLVLGVHALVTSGAPLPFGAAPPPGQLDGVAERVLSAKDRSRPFPCRDKPCGCVSADQCFRQCCCHTPAQLLAWARRNDVEPAVLAALERRAVTEVDVAAVASAASCCAAPAVVARAACRVDAAPEPASGAIPDCCSAGRSPDAAAPVDEPVSRHTLVLKAMLACGGIVAEWFSIGAAPPPPAVVAVDCVSPLAVTLVDRDGSLRPRHVAPDVPPPRVA